MIRRATIVLLALVTFAMTASADDVDKELKELKKRMDARYATLLSLREAGKVGETYLGYVEAVKSEYLDDEVKVDDEKTTVKALLKAENDDRSRAYSLLAEKSGGTKEGIAKIKARHSFDRAGPDEWLKTKNGWKQKKDLGKEEEK